MVTKSEKKFSKKGNSMKKMRKGAVASKPEIHHLLYSYIPPFILSLIGYLFYKSSLHYGFQFDDLANITKLYSIRNSTFSQLFFQGPRWISYWLNTLHYQIGKFNPFSYRLFNVMSHTTTSIIIFYLFYSALLGLKKRSFFSENAFLIAICSAVLFLLHPVQTQTVSYVIQGQLEGLAGFFIVSITLCFYFAYHAHQNFLQKGLLFLVFVLGAFSCGTKEIAIMSPFLLFVFDWFFVAQGDIQSIKNRKLFYCLYSIMIFSIYLYFLKPKFFIDVLGLKIEARNNIGNVLTENPTDKILPLHYFISQFKVILHYLFIFIWPFNISVEYDWKLVKSFFSLDCFVPFLLLCGVFGILLRTLQQQSAHVGTFGLIWFFVSIAPRSSFIPSSELLTDYKTYTGSIGITFMLAVGIVKLGTLLFDYVRGKNLFLVRREFDVLFLFIFLLPLGYFTHERNKVWSSGKNFWANIIANAPGKARAYNNYGVALSEEGFYKESIPYYQKAIEMDNRYPDPLNNIAVAYSFIGNLDKAIEALRRSIIIAPMYPEAYNNLASFLISKKEYDQAEKSLHYALQLRPYYGKAYFNLGKIHLFRDDLEKAYECFKSACTRADLDNETGFQLYGQISMKLQKYADAAFAYNKLVELKPTKENLFNSAQAFFLNNNFDQCIMAYKKLLNISPNEQNAWYNLGETYIRVNNPQQALSAFQKAKSLGNSVPNLPLRLAYCHKLLNNIVESEKILNDVLQQPSIPEQFKLVARNELALMKASHAA